MYDFDVFIFDEASYQKKCNDYDERIRLVKDEFLSKVTDYYNELENVVFNYFKKRNNSYSCILTMHLHEKCNTI